MMTSSFLLEDLPSPNPPPPQPPLPVLSGPGAWTPSAAFLSPFPVGTGEVPVPLGDPFRLKKFGNASLPLLPRLRKLSFLKFVERNHNLQSQTPSPR